MDREAEQEVWVDRGDRGEAEREVWVDRGDKGEAEREVWVDRGDRGEAEREVWVDRGDKLARVDEEAVGEGVRVPSGWVDGGILVRMYVHIAEYCA